jgi:geranylgeranyl diphosphate synthase type II
MKETHPSGSHGDGIAILRRLRQKQELVTRSLEERLSLTRSPLLAAMRDAVLGDGKRLRPILCLEACEWAGGKLEHALPAACAIEMIHKMTLVHDDLPAMDDARTRNGKPALHRTHGEAMAILAGDGLLVEAFGSLASTDGIDPARVLRAIRRLCYSLGSGGVAGGQAEDILARTHPSPHDGDGDAGHDLELHELYARKTGSLFEAAVVVGAELGGASDAQIAAISRYGLTLGVAFQITDDLLDSAPEDGAERRPEMTNYAHRFGARQARRKARELLHEAVATLAAANGGETSLFAGIAHLMLERCGASSPEDE